MNLNDLSNEYLKYMIKEYSKSQNDTFLWEQLNKLFPKENEKSKSDAIRTLGKNGLVNNTFADGVPYIVILNLNAVIEAEQNTKFKKLYKFLKEVREWI